ncbi:hypothetical protein Gotur_027154 [Gossypium turneri]
MRSCIGMMVIEKRFKRYPVHGSKLTGKRLAVGLMITPEYNEWWVKRINDNTPKSNQENSQSIEEYLRVVPSELEIIRQDFERRNADLEKKIEQIEEEKMNLRLDIDVQKIETEKLRKGKNKAEEELDSLKADYKKLRLLMRTVELGKTSEHEALEKSLSESQKEKCELKDKVTELERSLRQCLEVIKIRNSEQLHYFQNQVRSIDHIMGKPWSRFEK